MGSDSTLGAHLRRCREQSGLSLDAIAERSRVVARFVQALESDQHDLLPAPVYVRGFIRAHCQETGASAEDALAMYEAQVPAARPQPVRAEPPPSAPARPAGPGPSRRRLAVVGAVAVVTLGALGVVVARAWRPPSLTSRPATAGPTGAPAGGAAGRPSPEPAPVPAAPEPALPAPVASATSGSPASLVPTGERVLIIRVVDTTWVRVKEQGSGVSLGEGTLAPGTVREWRSADRFLVSLGNAGGVEIEIDGRAVPALGGPGQVVRDVMVPDEPKP